MNNLSYVFEHELLPLIFNNVPTIFPEFDFKSRGNHWVSNNKRRISGEEGDSKEKVWIYQNTPFFIKEYTTDGEALIKYIERRENLSWADAIRYLAKQVGYYLDDSKQTEEQAKQAKELILKAEILEVINDYFVNSLKMDEAKPYLDYLVNERGYGSLDLGLGYIPSQQDLKAYILSKGFSESEYNNAFTANSGIGNTHQLTIPYRDTVGRIIGFAFRAIKPIKPKYLYTNGLQVSSNLFNLKAIRDNKKDLVLVEGLLDALHATALGIENVVALGGNSITPDQLALIKKSGSKKVTLCLDNDKAGNEGTHKAINKIIEHDINIKLYVASLPPTYKDPDELIRECGLESLKLAINEAQSWYLYELGKYLLSASNTQLTDKERDACIEAIVDLGARIKDPRDRNILITNYTLKGQSIGLTPEVLIKVMEARREDAAKQKQIDNRKRELLKASALLDKQQLSECNVLLSNISKQINTESDEIDFDKLIEPDSEEEIKLALQNEPDNIDSGFAMDGRNLKIPVGEISVVAAATGHGKTTFLINLAINLTKSLNNKTVYFFTYEETKHALYPKIMNIYINKVFDNFDNRKFIKDQLKNGSTQHNEFHQAKERFFNELIHSKKLKINYVTFSANKLISAIYHAYEQGNAGAIIIDYVQLLQIEGSKHNTRQEEVKQLCQLLKFCAAATGLPIVAAAQFTREVKSISDLHPTRIREAGDIEQISSLAIGLWNKNIPAADVKIEDFKGEPFIHARIMKNRDGINNISEDFAFNGNTGKISNHIKATSAFGYKSAKGG